MRYLLLFPGLAIFSWNLLLLGQQEIVDISILGLNYKSFVDTTVIQ